MERLQKILSARGVLSRRAAERYIQAGRVTVNGIPAELGQQADPDRDVIAVDGVELPRQTELVYLLLNKPRGTSPPSPTSRGAGPWPSWWPTAASGSTPWGGWT